MSLLTIECVSNLPCDDCTKKIKQFLIRPFSLEYLALRVLLNQYNKNEISLDDNIFERINWPSKWENWYFRYFSVPRPNDCSKELCFNVPRIIPIISRTALDFFQQQPNQQFGLTQFCKFCHTMICDKCGWIIVKFKIGRETGHLAHCVEEY